MTTAIAIDVSCSSDGGMQDLHIDPPADRSKTEGVANYQRLGGRISDSVLERFSWQGQIYLPMGKALIQAKDDLKAELN